MIKSDIEKVCLEGFTFYVKRDDKLGIINGNKARKLSFYMQNASKFKNLRLISYGSSQSNALAALSIFAKQNAMKFIFVCEKIATFLKENPSGNYALALKNGALIVENTDFKTKKEKALSLLEKDDIFIKEGIAMQEAKQGIKELALEIKEQAKELGLDFELFLPSGTGTSAAFLALTSEFKVYTCACVGDEAYLKEQILDLEPNFDFKKLHILPALRKFHFAKPYKEHLFIYKKALKECKIEFDLLYDSVGLQSMLLHQKSFTKPLLYIHQGGIIANESMLKRYEFKNISV